MAEVDHSITLEFRKFNRFYTNVLGFLNEHIYDSPFSLTETRIVFEIKNTPIARPSFFKTGSTLTAAM
ncbi:Putative HTH-type DNA-binding domain-containing acetyltransferase YbfA [Bacillus sonorensis]|uniref:HTH-type DNA-binding domain-containing acetyltransferase YbfA n=1 Tax=Bacillus sonorensis TaxID=119858 RepID=A0ABN5ANE2_9BACI|nr:Putative HTH-type DNA-binding domain-containing acetyltransferase YbfA [Bacillus sonorensis]